MNNANIFNLYGKYKNLYLFNSGRGTVLFKPLSYSKFETAKKISKAYPSLAPIIEDNIWEECVVEHTFPNSIDNMNSGLVSTIVRLILHFSNPTSQEEIAEEMSEIRKNSTNIREDIIIKICQAFPAYTPEDIENMEWKEQLKRLVQAEKILGTNFDFIDSKTKKTTQSVRTEADPFKKIGSDGQQYIDFEKENQILTGL